jgi:polar amino acid transport system substrate-binding protein
MTGQQTCTMPRYTHKKIWAYIVLIVTCLGGLTNIAKAEEITLVADVWCPYNCEPDSENPGYMVEIAQQAFAKHDIKVKYKTMSWTSALEETKKQKYEGVIGAYYRDAPYFVYPQEPQGRCINAFFVRSDSDWKYKDTSSLNNKILGVVSDYSYTADLDSYIAKHKKNPMLLQEVYGDNATQSNILKLITGKVDVIVEDVQVIAYYLSQHNLSNLTKTIKKAGRVPDSSDEDGIVFIAFAPGNPNSERYAKILSDETKALRQSGELEKILSKYGISDFVD